MSLEPKEVDSSRSQHQSNDGQTALYENYGKVIFGYLRLHMRSVEDAEDLLLEVFLVALEQHNLDGLSPREQLAWLRRVAHNKLANAYRRTSRNPQVALDALVETLLEDEDPEHLTLRQEEQQQLRSAIQRLPVLQQQILQLRYGDGLRCPEIAVLLNKRETAIRKHLSRSILFLRQVYALSEKEGESRC